MPSVWDRLESQWPLTVGGRHVGYSAVKQKMHDFLRAKGVIPRAFSHYGVVTRSARAVLPVLSELTGIGKEPLKRNWVEAYKVFVARTDFEGIELELIEPAGESAFAAFLNVCGEGVHHLAFRVADIEGCLQALKAHGVELMDETPRAGSHGKVAFVRPGPFEPLHLELCELAGALS